MKLKKVLKTIKLHEQQISIALGILILLATLVFVFRYIKDLNNQSLQPAATQTHGQIHTVARGETLWSISLKYYKKGSLWKKIADANNITDPRKIEVGQNLIVPQDETQPAQTPTPNPPQITKEAASTVNEITGDSYIVVRGDNLWKIAVRSYGDGTRWHEIAETNKLKDPNLIHSGNVFIIPR